MRTVFAIDERPVFNYELMGKLVELWNLNKLLSVIKSAVIIITAITGDAK
tara:strand:- start:9694 stop:9843 length:150 start_codon:yes stop_codon:yes gene_type:complete